MSELSAFPYCPAEFPVASHAGYGTKLPATISFGTLDMPSFLSSRVGPDPFKPGAPTNPPSLPLLLVGYLVLLGIWPCWVFEKGSGHREQAPSTRAVALIHQSVCAV